MLFTVSPSIGHDVYLVIFTKIHLYNCNSGRCRDKRPYLPTAHVTTPPSLHTRRLTVSGYIIPLNVTEGFFFFFPAQSISTRDAVGRKHTQTSDLQAWHRPAVCLELWLLILTLPLHFDPNVHTRRHVLLLFFHYSVFGYLGVPKA